MASREVLRFVVVPVGDFDELSEGGAYTTQIDLPASATIVGQPALTSKGLVVFAIADPDEAATTEREFVVVGNGRALPDGADELSFRGTVKVMPGAPTFHVFELAKVTA